MIYDLISRKEAIDAVKHAWAKGLEPSQYIEIIPSVPAVPLVHGKWISSDQREEELISGICSHCRWEAHYFEDDVSGMPYCPNCGARMDLEEQDA
jgi:hypothetical protein